MTEQKPPTEEELKVAGRIIALVMESNLYWPRVLGFAVGYLMRREDTAGRLDVDLRP